MKASYKTVAYIKFFVKQQKEKNSQEKWRCKNVKQRFNS